MKIKLLLLITPALFAFGTSAQEQKNISGESTKSGDAVKSAMFFTKSAGITNTAGADLKWRPILTKKCISFEPMAPDQEIIEKVKAEKLLLKQHQNNTTNKSELSALSGSPVVGTNFYGNMNNGGSPLDNSIAVSDGGIIVSVANTTIEVDDMAGTNLFFNNIVAFINDPQITNVCDPVVVYDKGSDRFVFFAQECSGSSSNSKLIICFSQTNNPATGGWWIYKLTGNPLSDNSWFDYPKMAVSSTELYISGNLFSDAGTFNEAVLYQINKTNGYSGANINWQYWHGISGSPFTLLPVGNGQGLSSGPGCYLVSTTAAGASAVNLYHLTDDMTGNPAFNYNSIPTTAYSPAANSQQQGTATLLDNGDCRTLSGFYLNGIIHFVFHSDIGSGWNGINYNRLNVASLSNQSSTFGLAGSFDYSYPSVVSYAAVPTDKSVMIGFGSTSSAIYPQMRVVNCDNAMNWSASTLVKQSLTYASYTSTTKERWGDYTGTARKHNSPTTSIWMNGMVGSGNTTHLWETWIAEIHGNITTGINENANPHNLKLFPNPVVEAFTIEFTLNENVNLEIDIVDISGRMVKELYNGKGLEGENVFSFNKANLSAGTYFLVIKNNANIIKNEKIIIAD